MHFFPFSILITNGRQGAWALLFVAKLASQMHSASEATGGLSEPPLHGGGMHPDGVWPDLFDEPGQTTSAVRTSSTALKPERSSPARARLRSVEFSSPARARLGSVECSNPARARLGSVECSSPARARLGSVLVTSRELATLSSPSLQQKLEERRALVSWLAMNADPAWAAAASRLSSAIRADEWPELPAGATWGDEQSLSLTEAVPLPRSKGSASESSSLSVKQSGLSSVSEATDSCDYEYHGKPGNRRVVESAFCERGSQQEEGLARASTSTSAPTRSTTRASSRRAQAWEGLRLSSRALLWCLPFWFFFIVLTLLEGYVFGPIGVAELQVTGHPADFHPTTIGADCRLEFDASTGALHSHACGHSAARASMTPDQRLMGRVYLRLSLEASMIIAWIWSFLSLLTEKNALKFSVALMMFLPMPACTPLYVFKDEWLNSVTPDHPELRSVLVLVAFCCATIFSAIKVARTLGIPVRGVMIWVASVSVIILAWAVTFALTNRVLRETSAWFRALWLVALPIFSEVFHFLLTTFVTNGNRIRKLMRLEASCSFQFVFLLPILLYPVMLMRLIINAGTILDVFLLAGLQAVEELFLRLTGTRRTYCFYRCLRHSHADATLVTLDPFWRERQAVNAVTSGLVGLFALVWIPVIYVAFEEYAIVLHLPYDEEKYVDGKLLGYGVLVQLVLSLLVDGLAIYHEVKVQGFKLERAWRDLYSRLPTVVFGAATAIAFAYVAAQAGLKNNLTCNSKAAFDPVSGQPCDLQDCGLRVVQHCFCPCDCDEYPGNMGRYCANVLLLVSVGQFDVTRSVENGTVSVDEFRAWLLGNASMSQAGAASCGCLAWPFR